MLVQCLFSTGLLTPHCTWIGSALDVDCSPDLLTPALRVWSGWPTDGSMLSDPYRQLYIAYTVSAD